MENITKALLIAAAILLVIMILSTVVLFKDRLAIYLTAQHEATMLEQAVEFNNKFQNYNGKTIRGNELVSLMNRIIDYNNYRADIEGYERVILTVDLKGHQNELKYKGESGQNALITGSIINNESNDQQIKIIAETSGRLVAESGISGLTDVKLQKLSSEIHNIVDEENATDKKAYKDFRAQKLNKILGCSLKPDDNVDNIKKVTYQYHQFTQFKRAIFECTNISYSLENGRVNGMQFEVVIENGIIKSE